MFPENQANQNQAIIEYGEDIQDEQTDFSHVTKHPYTNKLFCWIQSGDTKQVINFFNTFPHLINQFCTTNNWNPFMYAVRYGNMELIQYFSQTKMKTSVPSLFNHVSMTHAAVYSGDYKIIKHVLTKMNCTPNPSNSQISPLKIAMKVGNAKMVELLISRGAYYVYGDVMNNIQLKPQGSTDENSKYTNILNNKQNIANNAVVEDTQIKDCPIKETLRWARIRQIMYLHNYSKKHPVHADIQHKFDSLNKIISNKQHLSLILKLCIGNGDSIFKVSQLVDESKQKQKEQNPTTNKKQNKK